MKLVANASSSATCKYPDKSKRHEGSAAQNNESDGALPEAILPNTQSYWGRLIIKCDACGPVRRLSCLIASAICFGFILHVFLEACRYMFRLVLASSVQKELPCINHAQSCELPLPVCVRYVRRFLQRPAPRQLSRRSLGF